MFCNFKLLFLWYYKILKRYYWKSMSGRFAWARWGRCCGVGWRGFWINSSVSRAIEIRKDEADTSVYSCSTNDSAISGIGFQSFRARKSGLSAYVPVNSCNGGALARKGNKGNASLQGRIGRTCRTIFRLCVALLAANGVSATIYRRQGCPSAVCILNSI